MALEEPRHVVLHLRRARSGACWLVAIAVSCSISCEAPRHYLGRDVTPRAALRSEVLGCWQLFAVTDRRLTAPPDVAPMTVRLDSGARDPSASRTRILQRLDTLGRPLPRDAEGFAVDDDWVADARHDRIRLHFNNGLYGSTWVLTIPTQAGSVDTLRGESQGFGDVVPPPPYPVRPVMATRIACVATADTVADASPHMAAASADRIGALFIR